MNYELAKKLKDAGFPQKGNGFTLYPNDGIHTEVSFPTLSELIEECGGNSKALIQQNNKTMWEYAIDGRGAIGQTPEEAVANLWLELNKS